MILLLLKFACSRCSFQTVSDLGDSEKIFKKMVKGLEQDKLDKTRAARRYPQRNVARINYTESEDCDDEHTWSYCEYLQTTK